MTLITRGGNTPKNQEIKYIESGCMFVSYDTNIVLKHSNNNIYLDSYYWDYSATTGRYRNQFLNEGIAETRKGIESGYYILTNLQKKVYLSDSKLNGFLFEVLPQVKELTLRDFETLYRFGIADSYKEEIINFVLSLPRKKVDSEIWHNINFYRNNRFEKFILPICKKKRFTKDMIKNVIRLLESPLRENKNIALTILKLIK
tara:strand:+ start:159 stop:764 length:606 start_codon:yes stop_codon:yes gene_type:complete